MKQSLMILAVVVVVVLGFYVYATKNNTDTQNIETQNNEEQNTNTQNTTPAVQGKLDINVVCEGALAYMTFQDGESADAFVAECKEGKHPEVIEQYRAQMNLGDGAAI